MMRPTQSRETKPVDTRPVETRSLQFAKPRRLSQFPVARTGCVPVCALLALGLLYPQTSAAETCTTQSALPQAPRESIAGAAHTLAALVQANNTTALETSVVAEIAHDFSAFRYLVNGTSAKLSGATLTVDQVYLLDATSLKRNPDNSAPDAQFFCSLNRTTMEVEFSIPALPPGSYAFAIVNASPAAGATNPAPSRLAFLLRQDVASSKWQLAGFYPSSTIAAGHDGLWYWTQARQLAAGKQPWNAWLYYQAAAKLLQPAPFVVTTHLDKLRTEAAAAAPPTLSEGVSADAPLVVKGADGTEYHITNLGVDDSLGQPTLDISAHLRVDSVADPTAARKRNNDAASALLAAYPEMRKPFHGVWIYAEAPSQSPFATEQPMSDIK